MTSAETISESELRQKRGKNVLHLALVLCNGIERNKEVNKFTTGYINVAGICN